jgi:hypothetical protein
MKVLTARTARRRERAPGEPFPRGTGRGHGGVTEVPAVETGLESGRGIANLARSRRQAGPTRRGRAEYGRVSTPPVETSRSATQGPLLFTGREIGRHRVMDLVGAERSSAPLGSVSTHVVNNAPACHGGAINE